jgi:hypothetical protein
MFKCNWWITRARQSERPRRRLQRSVINYDGITREGISGIHMIKWNPLLTAWHQISNFVGGCHLQKCEFCLFNKDGQFKMDQINELWIFFFKMKYQVDLLYVMHLKKVNLNWTKKWTSIFFFKMKHQVDLLYVIMHLNIVNLNWTK